MGHGDDIMATGMAKGAHARGKRIAFGNGQKIIWGPFSAEIFRGNPNIASPGSERASDIEWHPFCKGNRIYNKYAADRWIWNYEFRPIPGEIYFQREPAGIDDRRVVIEPNVPRSNSKAYSINKQWPVERYQMVVDALVSKGFRVVQPWYRQAVVRLMNVKVMDTPTYTDALALLKTAHLYIGPEGGLHHGSAAVGTRAVVLFGGFVPPQVTGYDTHANLTGGPVEACGKFSPCSHCSEAMKRISVDEVVNAAQEILDDV